MKKILVKKITEEAYEKIQLYPEVWIEEVGAKDDLYYIISFDSDQIIFRVFDSMYSSSLNGSARHELDQEVEIAFPDESFFVFHNCFDTEKTIFYDA